MGAARQVLIDLVDSYASSYKRENQFKGDATLRDQIKRNYSQLHYEDDKAAVASYIRTRALGFTNSTHRTMSVLANAVPVGVGFSLAYAKAGGSSERIALFCCVLGTNVGVLGFFYKRQIQIIRSPDRALALAPYEDLKQELNLLRDDQVSFNTYRNQSAGVAIRHRMNP